MTIEDLDKLPTAEEIFQLREAERKKDFVLTQEIMAAIAARTKKGIMRCEHCHEITSCLPCSKCHKKCCYKCNNIHMGRMIGKLKYQ